MWAHKLLPYYRSTRRHSAALIAGSKHNYGDFPQWAKEKCIYIPENGVDPELFKKPRTPRAGLPLRDAFIGRLQPLKGPDMLLEAASEFSKLVNSNCTSSVTAHNEHFLRLWSINLVFVATYVSMARFGKLK